MFDFTTYIETLATQLNDIAHSPTNKRFYLASNTQSIEEILANITNLRGLILVAEDNLEGSLVENPSLATFDRQLCSFFLMKKADDMKMSSRREILAEFDTVISKIIARLRRDYYTDNEGTTNTGLRNIEWNSLSYFTFGPVLSNMYGMHVSFTMLHQVKFTFDANDWTIS